jgi:Tfp pilus assembly protein PilF
MERVQSFLRIPLLCILLLCILLLTLGLATAGVSAAEPTVRAEVGKPLQAAQELIKAQQYREALAKIAEADAVPDKTPDERFLIDRYRGVAAVRAGDHALALQAWEAVIASGRLAPPEQRAALEAVSDLAYRTKDYAKAASYARRYLAEGGTNDELKTLLVNALYLADDYTATVKELTPLIEAAEQAGRAPAEQQLRMLASAQIKNNDNAGYLAALEKLVTHYPKQELWAELIARVAQRPGFSERLTLDLLRLKHATGNLKSGDELAYMAQLALRAANPVEAKKLLDEGFASGLLGNGPDAAQHKQLLRNVTNAIAEDRAAVVQGEKEIARSEAAATGAKLFNVGHGLTQHGRSEKGLDLMERGLQKGGLKQPEEAKLHLGLAYLNAGRKDKARQVFETVKGNDGSADLARLWAIKAKSK